MRRKENLERKKTTLDEAGRIVLGRISLAGLRGLTYKDIRELTSHEEIYPNLLPTVLSYLIFNHLVLLEKGQYITSGKNR